MRSWRSIANVFGKSSRNATSSKPHNNILRMLSDPPSADFHCPKRVTGLSRFSGRLEVSGSNLFQIGQRRGWSGRCPTNGFHEEVASGCPVNYRYPTLQYQAVLLRCLGPVLDFQFLNSCKGMIVADKNGAHRQGVGGDHQVEVSHRLAVAF